MARRISVREILADLRSGMNEAALAKKYGLSASELKQVFKRLHKERAARAQAIADDLKTGLSESEVRGKYRLSGESLQRIIETLLAEGLVTGNDLHARSAISQDVVILDLRRRPRFQPSSEVAVCEGGFTGHKFSLNDISEHGFSAKGIECRTGETLSIVVLGDEFGEIIPFEFQAECRWAKKDTVGGNLISGFEIRHISPANRDLLRDFIKNFTSRFHPEGEG